MRRGKWTGKRFSRRQHSEPGRGPSEETAIARSGAAGVSRERLEKALGIPGETLENLLRALTASGQVVMQVRREDR